MAYLSYDYKAPDFESYEIQYSTKSNSGFKTISKVNYVRYGSVKGLKHGKTYYFRARTVREIAGKRYYSKWTEVKKKKVNIDLHHYMNYISTKIIKSRGASKLFLGDGKGERDDIAFFVDNRQIMLPRRGNKLQLVYEAGLSYIVLVQMPPDGGG